MVTSMLFVFFGSAEVQPWNFAEENMQDKTGTRTENYKKNDLKDKNEDMTRF